MHIHKHTQAYTTPKVQTRGYIPHSRANGKTGLRDEGVSQGALPGVEVLVGRAGPASFQGTRYKGRKHWVERRLSPVSPKISSAR